MDIRVRPTGVLIEDGKILLIRQFVTSTRGWSMPGGKLEPGETIEQCLVREWKEETGLDIRIKELLYITDRFRGSDTHVVHIMFLLERTSEKPGELEWTNHDPCVSKTAQPIREIKMTPIDELINMGFSPTFYELVKADFPRRGNYKGDYYSFYGETPPDERR